MNISKIKKIRKIESKSNLYDIETKKNHNYFANDILVHNSNFSIWTDGTEVRFAKKTGFLKESENFYSYDRIKESLKEKILKLYKDLNIVSNLIKNNTIETVTVFGELFGGSFRHPDVQNVNDKPIQKGIFYSPEIEFMAFDIYLNNRLVDIQDFIHYSKIGDFFYARILFRGTLQECLNYSNEFNSTIPELLGYPKLTDNVCEGVVIKPATTIFFGNGSRVILKNKNKKWSEKSKKSKIPKIPVKLSDTGKKQVENLLTYLTENRLRNVLSKIGEVTQKDFGKILGLMMKDMLEDYYKDFENPNLETSEDKLVKKLVSQEISNLIRPNFRNMIDGMF